MIAASSISLEIPTKKERISIMDTGRRNAIYGKIMAHRVFFSFRVFNNIKSVSKHTCGERRSPHRQNRNTKCPSFHLIWHTPNAAKDATNTTPIKVAMVTIKLFTK